jgi:hypothetical protein
MVRRGERRSGPISASRTAAGSYNIERELPAGCAEIPINTTGNKGAVGEQKERFVGAKFTSWILEGKNASPPIGKQTAL